MNAPVELTVRSRAGLPLLRATVAVRGRAQRDGSIYLVGDTEDGRRVSLTIPFPILEDVPTDPAPDDIRLRAKEAEDAVVNRVLSRWSH
jgi:hypothetical protein